MGTPQTTYNIIAPAGSAGFLADTDDAQVASYYNGEAGDLPVGIGVVEDGVVSHKAKLPAGASDKFAGVVFNTYGRDPNGLTTGAYSTGSQIPVLQHGKVFVKPEQDVTPADPVYLRYTANGPLTPGSFRKDADTAKALLVKGAKWEVGALAGGIATLTFDVNAALT